MQKTKNGNTITGEKSVYVEAGSVEIGVGLTQEYKNIITTDNPDKVDIGNIIYDSVESIDWNGSDKEGKGDLRDYIELTFAPSYSNFSSGYFASGDVISAQDPIKKYIPRAVLEWVKPEGENVEEYLQVTSSGFLPSGRILEIGNISEGENIASVGLALDTNNTTRNVFTNSITQGDEEKYSVLTLKKDKVNAGYISAAEGTVTGLTYYVKNANDLKAVTSNAISATTSNNRLVFTKDGDTYTTTVTATASTQINGEAGFIKNIDEIKTGYLATNGESQVFTESTTSASEATLIVDKLSAVLNSTNPGNISVTINEGDLLTGTSTTDGFAITTSHTAGSIKITPNGSSGFLGVGDTTDITVAQDSSLLDHDTIYIKKGNSNGTGATVINSTGNDAPTMKLNKDSGKYSVSLSGKVKVGLTLEEGYYKGDSTKHLLDVTSTDAAALSVDALTIAAGSVGVVNNPGDVIVKSQTESVDSEVEIVKLSTSNYEKDEEGKDTTKVNPNLVAINFSTSASATVSVTEGYIENYTEKDNPENDTVQITGTRYIELYKATAESVGDNSLVYTHIIGDNTSDSVDIADGSKELSTAPATLATKDKYMRYDTKISLGKNAMGSEVSHQLNELRNRLLGF